MSSFIPFICHEFCIETNQFLPENLSHWPKPEERLTSLIAELAQGVLQDPKKVQFPENYRKHTFWLIEEEPYEFHYYESLDGDQKGILTDIGKTFCRVFEGNTSEGYPLASTIASKIVSGPFAGNELEQNLHLSTKHLPDSYWDDWKEREDLDKTHQIYRWIIYPSCNHVLNRILKSRGNENATILEICAGDGESTLEMIKSTFRISKYYAVDFNHKSITQAKERFKCIKTEVDLHFLQADITKKYDLPGADKESIDVCVGIGALTGRVLASKEAALSALEQINFYLCPGGWLILSGAENCLLTAEDLTQAGFYVTNKHISRSFQNFYLAQKRVRNPQDDEVRLASPLQIQEDYFV